MAAASFVDMLSRSVTAAPSAAASSADNLGQVTTAAPWITPAGIPLPRRGP
jgi:hypothetical protein